MSSHSEDITLRTRVVGARQAAAETALVAGSVDKMSHSVDRSNAKMAAGTQHGFAYNQALFTVRRTLYGMTLAAAAGAAAVGLLGFKFNMTMEQNTIAMTHLLGSEQKATDQLEHLYELAAKTPFEFLDLTQASRKFLAFGFDLDQTNRYLAATADAVAIMGEPQLIDRVVRAFGQINAKGRVMGEELLQLTEAQIPALRYLQEALGLTGDQLGRIGELGIPANVAIEAITAGMQRDFGGASEKLANTVTGQLATLRDYSKRLFGDIMTAPFKATQEGMKPFLAQLQLASEAMTKSGFIAMVDVWDNAIGAGGKLTSVFKLLNETARGFAGTMGVAWSVAKPFAILLGGLLYSSLYLVANTLGLVSDHGWLFVPVIQILIGLWLIGYTRLKVLAFWMFITDLRTRQWTVSSKILIGWMTIQELWTKRLIFVQKLYAFLMSRVVFWTRLYTVATVGAIRGAKGQFVAMTLLEKGLLRLRFALIMTTAFMMPIIAATWAFTIALLANPITWIILGLVALGLAIVLLVKHWDTVTNAVGRAWQKMKDFRNWISENAHGFDPLYLIPGFGPAKAGYDLLRKIPGLAAGGNVIGSGIALVGEHGPEVVRLDAGARVTPLAGAQSGVSAPLQLPQLNLLANLILDGKKFATVMAEYRQDEVARA